MSIEFYDKSTSPYYSVWTVWAENHGSRDAHGVEVLLDRVNPITGKVYYKFNPNTNTAVHDEDALDFGNIDYVQRDSRSGVWRIGALPAGSRKGARIFIQWEWTSGNNPPPVTTNPGGPTNSTGLIGVQLAAEIFNPRHRDPLPENNRATAWGVIKKTGGFFARSDFSYPAGSESRQSQARQ